VNAHQRRKAFRERLRENLSHTCPECDEPGKHFVHLPENELCDALCLAFGVRTAPGGFWTCAKFYGPDGKRKELEAAP
jgi:hypothetical protein